MTLTRLESEARPGGELVGSQNDLHAVACAVSTEGEDTAAILRLPNGKVPPNIAESGFATS